MHGDDFTALGSPDALNKFEEGMQKSFECKLKGRLGLGPSDCKEMRVLNRIVRVNDHGLLYEADPRHAEMLIKAFDLGEAKAVVTPGIKIADENADLDKIDSDAAAEINKIITELRARPRAPTNVTFNDDVQMHSIEPYSDVYGRHPREFVFDKYGMHVPSNPSRRIDITEHPSEFDEAHSSSPNARRQILERTLRNGAAWETSSVEYVNQISKKKPKKFVKQRLGSKAAKHAERMTSGGDDLEGEAATMYRALSARLLYLSMDRPEVAFASKELCRHFAHPAKIGVEALKRAVRFLIGLPRLVWNFPFQKHTGDLKIYVDTDFGGCQTTRRSTSGGVAMRGLHPIKH